MRRVLQGEHDRGSFLLPCELRKINYGKQWITEEIRWEREGEILKYKTNDIEESETVFQARTN